MHNNQTFLDRFIVMLGKPLAWLFWVIVAITTFEVAMRYLFNSPTYWVHELAMFIGGSLFLFGGSFALANDSHVRVVLFYDKASPKVRHYLNLFHHFMGIIFSIIMAIASYQMMIEATVTPWGDIHLETSGTAWDTVFPAILKILIFVIMIILCLQFFLKIIKEVRMLKGDM